ncbi:hypothetical protein CYMTET_56128 [Cymbomonas tetramitiformis]|uniref:Kinesin motor domain-containing protein n=1 Tax=Cymbomonas tetramitiformis TaxID=36881 RepID=A0AAE0EMN3_9CHLO|nr:hypothetical protein CYMTET_56128 [Cymbomonas tetramitiformis]
MEASGVVAQSQDVPGGISADSEKSLGQEEKMIPLSTDVAASKTPSDVTSVKVLLRVRPMSAFETSLGRVESLDCQAKSVAVGSGQRVFHFDAVHGPPATQEEVYSSMSDVIDGFLSGYNSTLFAYGQTGSGKTHTMGTSVQGLGGDGMAAGMLPRFLDSMFEHVEQHCREWSAHLSFVELHHEDLFDLLSEPGSIQMPLCLRDSVGGKVVIQGVEEEMVQSKQDVLAALERGCALRATAATCMNLHSSRSHALAIVTLNQLLAGEDPEDPEQQRRITSKFSFVDLAGSERVKKTMAEGARFKEGVSINQGLLALGKVISALADLEKKSGGRGHVPYRDSKLTRLLRDSLGGNSRTVMIACVSPADNDIEETLSTLRYAARASQIKNCPVQNVTQDDSAAQIAALQSKVAMLEQQLARLSSGTATPLHPHSRPQSAAPSTAEAGAESRDGEAQEEEDGEIEWMKMLVEESEAALQENGAGAEMDAATGGLMVEARVLDAAIRAREASLVQLQRTKRQLHEVVIREQEMSQRLRLLEAEITSVEFERQRALHQLQAKDSASEAEKVKMRERYEDKLKGLRTSLSEVKTQQKSAQQMKSMYERTQNKLETLEREIMKQKQQRIQVQRALKEKLMEQRKKQQEHTKQVTSLRRENSGAAAQIAKLNRTVEMRELALQRRQEDVLRLRKERNRVMGPHSRGAGREAEKHGMSKEGAEWLRESVRECAQEQRDTAALAAALERRDSAVRTLSQAVPEEDGEEKDAALVAEVEYCKTLVEEAQRGVEQHAGSQERLLGRVRGMQVAPARSLCSALISLASATTLQNLRLEDESRSLRSSLESATQALPGVGHDEAGPGMPAEAGRARRGSAELHAQALVQLEYENRIQVYVKEIAELKQEQRTRRNSAGAEAPATGTNLSTVDALKDSQVQVARQQAEWAYSMMSEMELEISQLREQLQKQPTESAQPESAASTPSSLPPAPPWHGSSPGSHTQSPAPVPPAGSSASFHSPLLAGQLSRGPEGSPGSPQCHPLTQAMSDLSASENPEAEVARALGHTAESATLRTEGRVLTTAQWEQWRQGGEAISDRQEMAFNKLEGMARTMGLSADECESAAAAAEVRVAAVWQAVLEEAEEEHQALCVLEGQRCKQLTELVAELQVEMPALPSADQPLKHRLESLDTNVRLLTAERDAHKALLESLHEALRERLADTQDIPLDQVVLPPEILYSDAPHGAPPRTPTPSLQPHTQLPPRALASCRRWMHFDY